MSYVRLSLDLPVSAERARELALKPDLLRFLLAPFITTPGQVEFPTDPQPGDSGSTRLWWFGILPSWRHHITLVELTPNEIYTNEHGGPVHTWNHRLTFTPQSEHSCRYTDEIEVEPGWRGLGTRLFVHAMFRHRHRRWLTLAKIIA